MPFIMLQTATLDKHVHTTNDYFLFKPLQGNRELNPLHLKRLKNSMEKNYLFTVIIVNENYEIIDGQHRFKNIMELGLPLNYIICNGYGLDEVHILNQNSKNWSSDDFMEGYIDLGYEDYQIYKAFKNKYKFEHNVCMSLLGGKKSSGNVKEAFNNGQFKVVNYSEAEKTAKQLWRCNGITDKFDKRSFILALITLFKNPQFKYDEFLKKLSIKSLKNCSTVNEYIQDIEDVYNYKRTDKVNLRYYKS